MGELAKKLSAAITQLHNQQLPHLDEINSQWHCCSHFLAAYMGDAYVNVHHGTTGIGGEQCPARKWLHIATSSYTSGENVWIAN